MDVENKDVEQTVGAAGEQPAGEQPAVEQPAVEQPAVEQQPQTADNVPPARTSAAAKPANPAPAPVAGTPTTASAPATPASVAATPAPAAAAPEDSAAGQTPTTPKSKVQIGSQRDSADKTLKPAKPKAVQVAADSPLLTSDEPAVPVEVPPVQLAQVSIGLEEGDDKDIEAELAAMSMDSILESTQAAEELELEENTRLKGTVANIHGDNVFFKLKGQFEGICSLAHFKTRPSLGDFVDVIVRTLNKEDGLYEVSIPGAAVSVADWSEIIEGSVVEATVTGSNTGGLEANVGSIKGFIPASQISRFRVESANFNDYIGKKLPCVVMEVNPDKRRLVISHRGVLDRENEEKRAELMEQIEVGQLREGTITKIMDFGAFCDLGGIEGLIHISKLDWDRVKHPSDVVKEGERVSVKIEKIDMANGRLSLSRRDTLDHPWEGIGAQFNANDIVTGTVTKTADFGAFVKLAPGVEGLVHISELAYNRVSRVTTVVNTGDEVQVKILSIDPESQKISLSIKQTMAAPVSKNKKKEVDEMPPEERELRVKRTSNSPLKGGTGRKSGGESFGLKW